VVLTPIEAEVESDKTPLVVADRPLDAEVESEVVALVADDSPVDSEDTPL